MVSPSYVRLSLFYFCSTALEEMEEMIEARI
jgi:hypothetical protein